MWPWIGFVLFILVMIAVDLGLFHRRPHVISMKEAFLWFGVWLGLAIIFNIGLAIFHERGLEAGLEFFAGYLVEKSLSIDNVFVFILIFNFFQISPVHQHKVLAFGIVGAIVLRVVFIVGGLALLNRFHWTIYLFGTFLIVTGLMMIFRKDSEYEPDKSWIVRFFRRFFPVASNSDEGGFFTRQAGRIMVTPLLIALLAIESSDIIFAADSIPAIFAITSDPFIVFTSNIFAMLGLRALYFAVQGFMKMFHLLHYGFAAIITILGVKMMFSDVYKVPITISLLLIVLILLVCVVISLLRPRKEDLKLLFQRTEQLGLIPFRRLLLIENIVDLGDLNVLHSMRPNSETHVVRLDIPWVTNMQMMKETRFSRYPLVESDSGRPVGVIHVKNVPFEETSELMTDARIRGLARPCLEFRETLSLEEALGRFQRRYDRLAIVNNDAGHWTGILTFEDLVQEIIGNMGDEFDQARAGEFISLVDALTVDRILLDLQADSLREAVEQMVARISAVLLPAGQTVVTDFVLRKKHVMPIYVGNGVAIPHGRFTGINRPILVFARCDLGVPVPDSSERAELIFLLITPNGKARMQSRLLANINALFKSEYVSERLRKSQSPDAVIEAIRAGQQVSLD